VKNNAPFGGERKGTNHLSLKKEDVLHAAERRKFRRRILIFSGEKNRPHC